MGLREKLIETFYKAATEDHRVWGVLTPVAAFFFFTVIMLLIVASLKVDKLLGLPRLFSSPWNILVSLPVIAIGVLLMLWSVLHFLKVRGTPVPFNPPPKLVTSGPYAYVRNPMLTGIFLWLFGLGVLFNSVSLTFVFTPFFILFNVFELKMVEEPELEKRFGKEYLEYKRRVPMFIPLSKARVKKLKK